MTRRRFATTGLMFGLMPVSSAQPLDCLPGLAVYSPIYPYDLVDCLEDSGSNCQRCRLIIIVG